MLIRAQRFCHLVAAGDGSVYLDGVARNALNANNTRVFYLMTLILTPTGIKNGDPSLSTDD
jgi:hypothetical protein